MQSAQTYSRYTLLIFSTIILLAQGAWVNEIVDSLSINYIAASWSSDGTVLAAGNNVDGGYLVHSTNYGYSWQRIASQYSFDNLYDFVSRKLSDNTMYYLSIAGIRFLFFVCIFNM